MSPERLWSPRWLALHALVLVVAASCAVLGVWQLRRLEQRQTQNALLDAREAQAPERLETLLGRYRFDVPSSDPDGLAYRMAVADGVYVPEEEVLLRTGESLGGRPGYHLLTPLLLDDGRALLVRRGWVPFELSTPPVAEALPPAGRVRVTGQLEPPRQPPEGFLADLAPRDPPGRLAIAAYPDPERLSQQMPFALAPVILGLRVQTPIQPGELPVVLPPEPRSDGPHLGYALQWFAFALFALIGYALVLRGLLRPRRGPRTARDDRLTPR